LPFSSSLPTDEKRQEAARKTVEKLRAKLNEEARLNNEEMPEEESRRQRRRERIIVYNGQVSSSDESDGAFPIISRPPEDPVAKYVPFILALPDCPMNVGFHLIVTSPDADRCCYCPCGPKWKRWREQFRLEEGHTCETERVEAPSKFTPNALVDHLEQMGLLNFGAATLRQPCVYHFTVLTYIQVLYEDYWGPSQRHKALYKKETEGFKRAEAVENLEQMKIRKNLEDQLAKERKLAEELQEKNKRLQEAMKVCSATVAVVFETFCLLLTSHLLNLPQQVSSMFTKGLEKKYDKRNRVMVKLGLSLQQVEPRVLTDKMNKKYEVLYANFRELWKYELGADKFKNIKIDVGQTFVLSELLKSWHDEWLDVQEDATCLFCYLDETNAGKLLVPWMMNYQGQ
jgi:hypothetical protein